MTSRVNFALTIALIGSALVGSVFFACSSLMMKLLARALPGGHRRYAVDQRRLEQARIPLSRATVSSLSNNSHIFAVPCFVAIQDVFNRTHPAQILERSLMML